MKPASEGVIKFELIHQAAPSLPLEACAELQAWFILCRQTGLLGQDPERYQGYAWGNLSRRWQDGFVITCTQISGKERLSAADFAWVSDFDISANRLSAQGPCRASSEAMSHGIIYQYIAEAQAVFHAHIPVIWQQAAELGLPITDAHIEYGTPEMAQAIAKILQAQSYPSQGLLSMGGHEDGILAWGESVEQTGLLMFQYLARAYARSIAY